MPSPLRSARVRAFAKVNLGLKVLHKRADGFHELRTIFQTISLADRLTLEYQPGVKSSVALRSEPEIADNLVVRAAEALLRRWKRPGRLEMRLDKQIPMGAGLGGGSSDAAAVLLSLPVLAGEPVAMEVLSEIGGELGSDVPFFLHGGTMLGLGRGVELYPLPDAPKSPGILVSPQVHVSTGQAYGALGRGLTSTDASSILKGLQALAGDLASGLPAVEWSGCENDFEPVVFRQHPQLRSIHKKLKRLGAVPARMSGSGSALYGLFPDVRQRDTALEGWAHEEARPIAFINSKQYRNFWWKSLAAHTNTRVWPPRSRYAR